MNHQQRKIFSVTAITNYIKHFFETGLNNLWIDGEVSNLKSPSSGHLYFTLKDKNSQIRAVIFKNQSKEIKFEIENGMRMVVHGKVTVYEPRGEYQIIIDSAEPKGAGALQKAFEQLKKKLANEGLFADCHKKSLPLLPKKIAIVTSPTGAAIKDILNVITRRFVNTHIVISPVKVQGEGSAEEIASAINELNNISDIDVCIIGRGGGSLEDLWAFNEEVLVRAIFLSRIPVVSAVGHETDFTISDFVADLRAPTPSVAAELVVKNKIDLAEKVFFLSKRLVNIEQRKIVALKSYLGNLIEKRNYFSPARKIIQNRQKIDELVFALEKETGHVIIVKREKINSTHKNLYLLGPFNRLKRLQEKHSTLERELGKAIDRRFVNCRNIINGIMKRLNTVSPLAVLDRGFSICTELKSGKVVKDAAFINKGDDLDVRLSKGFLTCTVKETTWQKR